MGCGSSSGAVAPRDTTDNTANNNSKAKNDDTKNSSNNNNNSNGKSQHDASAKNNDIQPVPSTSTPIPETEQKDQTETNNQENNQQTSQVPCTIIVEDENGETKEQAPQEPTAAEPAKEESSNEEQGGEEFSEFERLALELHNKYRATHGAPPMQLNREICDMAKNYALHLVKNDLFEHSKREDRQFQGGACGENLYWASGTSGDKDEASRATKTFYNEIKDYNFDEGGFTMGTGHFTQVVWCGSNLLGVGIASKGGVSSEHVVVCNYYPPGNVQGDFSNNVKPMQ